MTRRAVITGVGAVTPLGVGARTLHERWTAGACGVENGQAPCAGFDPKIAMSAKEARRSDRFTQLAVAACAEAIDEAGFTDGLPYAPERIGCVFGTGIGGIGTLEANHVALQERGEGAVSPLEVPLMMSNVGAAALSGELIRATQGAHNALMDMEEMEEAQLEQFRHRYEAMAQDARHRVEQGQPDTDTPEA